MLVLARINILILLCAFSASAQLPILSDSVSIENPSSGCFDFSSISSGKIFIWLSTCPQSVANNIQQSAGTVVTWHDYSTASNTFSASVGFAGSVAPTYHSTGGSHGGEWIDFSHAGGVGNNLGCTNALGTNQSVTIFIVHTDTCTSSGNSLFDCPSGTRQHYRLISTTADFMFAGSTMSPPPSKNSGKWMVRTMVFKGANSYVRTNGVLQGPVGNPGANALGKMALGNDNSTATPYRGGYEYVLAYNAELSTNDMQTVENALISEAHITP